MTAADNPYFARAAVNRLWAYFFGIGLVDPVDELGRREPAAAIPSCSTSWPGSSSAHDFDLKFLIRAITASQAYQLHQRRHRTPARTTRACSPACRSRA